MYNCYSFIFYVNVFLRIIFLVLQEFVVTYIPGMAHKSPV